MGHSPVASGGALMCGHGWMFNPQTLQRPSEVPRWGWARPGCVHVCRRLEVAALQVDSECGDAQQRRHFASQECFLKDRWKGC